MREFIARQNIVHYQEQLKTEKVPAKRAVLLQLLAEEETTITAYRRQARESAEEPTRH